MKKIFIVIVLILISSTAFTNGFPGESAWQNKEGSQLFIEKIDSDGKITGYFVNHAPHYPCANTPYPVTGWIMEGANILTFTVKWENTFQNCMALTSWTGYASKDGMTITTLWQFVKNGSSDVKEIVKGEDIFTFIEPQVTNQ
jgi:hypothetical protein